MLRGLDAPRESQLERPVEPVTLLVALDQRNQGCRIEPRALREAHAAAFRARLDLRDPEPLREQLEPGDREQCLERRRQQAEAVDELDL